MAKVKKLTATEFQDSISSGTVLVDFWAPWCAPCKMQLPVLEKVASKIGNKVTVAKIDIDKNSEVASQYKVQSIPTLLLFKDGKVVERMVGLQDEKSLTLSIESVL
jgi:thioredoxin 1